MLDTDCGCGCEDVVPALLALEDDEPWPDVAPEFSGSVAQAATNRVATNKLNALKLIYDSLGRNSFTGGAMVMMLDLNVALKSNLNFSILSTWFIKLQPRD